MLGKTKSIKITTFFYILNLLAGCALIVICHNNLVSTYVNTTSALLGMIMIVINMGMTYDAERHNNMPLLILQFWTLFHVVFRIITLFLTDYSTPLRRCFTNIDDMNVYISFLIVGILCLWLGLHYAMITTGKPDVTVPYNKVTYRRVLNLWWFTFALSVISRVGVPVVGGVATLLMDFVINILLVLVMMSIYAMSVWGSLDRKQRTEVIIAFVLYALLMTFGGSRSGFYWIIMMAMFVGLAVGVKSVPIKVIFGGVLMLPVLIFAFIYATYMIELDASNLSYSEKINMISLAVEHIDEMDMEQTWGRVFDRIGFLDMGAEMYMSRDLLDNYITIGNEFKALIDGITPGFDVFDQSKASRMITAAYNYPPNIVVSRSALLNTPYQSDELTLFGESILLFGIPLFGVFVLAVGILFRKFWLKGVKNNYISNVIIRTFTIYMFYVLLSSYGIDWFLNDVVVLFITLYIFNRYVFHKRTLFR